VGGTQADGGTVANAVAKGTWRVLGLGSAMVSTVITRKVMTAVWKKVRKSDPPVNPQSPDTTWSEAVGWAVATGIGMGVARLIAQRNMAKVWVKATGSLPPGLEESG
jgi:hypothetical protein